MINENCPSWSCSAPLPSDACFKRQPTNHYVFVYIYLFFAGYRKNDYKDTDEDSEPTVSLNKVLFHTLQFQPFLS